MNLKPIVYTVAVLVLLLPLCPYASTNTSILLVVVDQVLNDSVIAAVENTIDIMNDIYLLQYTTNNQVESHIMQTISI